MKHRVFFFLLSVFSVSTLHCAEISVFAASSLTDALKEIGVAYEGQGGAHVSFNFAASSLLARQIEEGAPAVSFFLRTMRRWIAWKKEVASIPSRGVSY